MTSWIVFVLQLEVLETQTQKETHFLVRDIIEWGYKSLQSTGVEEQRQYYVFGMDVEYEQIVK